MQFDVPMMSRMLTSQILNPGRGAGRVGHAPPRGMPVAQSVCVRRVCATGYGTRHADRACERSDARTTRQSHTELQHIMLDAQAYGVLLPRPRPADLAG
eukprot:1241093-Prymnesium_polylepis.1